VRKILRFSSDREIEILHLLSICNLAVYAFSFKGLLSFKCRLGFLPSFHQSLCLTDGTKFCLTSKLIIKRSICLYACVLPSFFQWPLSTHKGYNALFYISPYHSHPSQSRDAFADSWEVVEEGTTTVFFSKILDLLDVIWNWLQQVLELRLQEQKGRNKKKKTGQQRDGNLSGEKQEFSRL